MPFATPRLRDALTLAEVAHRKQLRKGGDSPYVLHPISVALLLAHAGASEDLIVAGVLHDVVEDSSVDIDAIRDGFGNRVAELVGAVTENKDKSWEERKAATMEHLRTTADDEIRALKAADVAVNIADVALDHARHGEDVWKRFKRGRDRQLQYYGSLVELLLDGPLPEALRAELEVRRADLAALDAAPRA